MRRVPFGRMGKRTSGGAALYRPPRPSMVTGHVLGRGRRHPRVLKNHIAGKTRALFVL